MRERHADLTAVSLFSGAGGLDIGLRASGWQILAQVEADGDCAETLKGHRATSAEVIARKIEDVPPTPLRRALGLKKGELGLLAGGPPCQPFTTHGLRRAITDARAASTFPQYLDFVREFNPAALLMENVDGLLSAALRHRPLALRGKNGPPMEWEERKGSFLHWLLSELANLGYAVVWGVLEAADYGVPQLRQRAFLVGTRDGDPCFLPKPTFGGKRPYKTLRDAVSGLDDPGPIQPLSEKKRSVYGQIPPGGNWRALPERIQRETMGAAYDATGGKSGWWRRLAWDEPAPTILGMPDHSSTGLIHPDEVRCLGLNECAALQSFPKGTKFAGRPRSQYQQVGNAVPPLVGKRVGSAVLAHLNGKRSPQPKPPAWRKQSANRRIGTHGWVIPGPSGPRFTIVVKVRDDHVWAQEKEPPLFAAR